MTNFGTSDYVIPIYTLIWFRFIFAIAQQTFNYQMHTSTVISIHNPPLLLYNLVNISR